MAALLLATLVPVLVPEPAAGHQFRTKSTTLPVGLVKAAAVYAQGEAYVFGGRDVATGLPVNTIYAYDPAAGTIQTMSASLPTPRYGVALVYDGSYIWSFGAVNFVEATASILRYDPATDTMLTVTNPVAIGAVNAAMVGSNIWLFGAKVWRFDPTTMTLTERLGWGPDSLGFAAFAQGNDVYVLGVGNVTVEPDKIMKYSTTTGQLTLASLVVPSTARYSAAVRLQGLIYVFGGQDPGGGHVDPFPIDRTQRLDLAAQQGSIDTLTVPTALMDAAAFSTSTRGYLLGGTCDVPQCTGRTIYEMDLSTTHLPVADFWWSPEEPRPGEIVTFYDASYRDHGQIVYQEWEFDGQASGTGYVELHTFADEGTFNITLVVTDNAGRKATKVKTITIEDRPHVVDLEWSPEEPIPRQAVLFTPVFAPGGPQFEYWGWDFGDGSRSSARTPEHRFGNVGTYRVRISAADVYGRTFSNSRAIDVVVGNGVVANFTHEPTTPRTQEYVYFRDTSVTVGDPVISRTWDFGDGRTSNEPNPTHVYVQDGPHRVQLTIRDVFDRTSTASRIVLVSPYDVSFRFDPDEPRSGQVVQFTDTSPNPDNLRAWRWDFGEGASSLDRNPVHAFVRPGTYVVTLVVSKADGTSTSFAREVTILATPPSAEFRIDPVNPTTADTVRFIDTTTGGPPVAWLWDFGDGTVSDRGAPFHRFEDPGEYYASLRVRDAEGRSSWADLTFTVTKALTNPPVANFTHARDPLYNSRVRFVDASSDPDGSVQLWYWNFGDGQTHQVRSPASAEDLRPVHQYRAPGDYDVHLTVFDDVGATTTVAETVRVGGLLPVVNFTWEPENPTAGRTVQFRDRSQDIDGRILRWEWDFGGGSTSSQRAPSHEYGRAGTFVVELALWDSDDYQSTDFKIITVAAVQLPQSPAGTYVAAPDGSVLLFALAGLAWLWSRRGRA